MAGVEIRNVPEGPGDAGGVHLAARPRVRPAQPLFPPLAQPRERVTLSLSGEPHLVGARPIDRWSRGIAGRVDGKGYVTRAFDFLHHDRIAARGDG